MHIRATTSAFWPFDVVRRAPRLCYACTVLRYQDGVHYSHTLPRYAGNDWGIARVVIDLGYKMRNVVGLGLALPLLVVDIMRPVHAEMFHGQNPTSICKRADVLDAVDRVLNAGLYSFMKRHSDESIKYNQRYVIQVDQTGGRISASQQDTVECITAAFGVNPASGPESDEDPLPPRTIRYNVEFFGDQFNVAVIDIYPKVN